jgi:hypothetical protein
VFWRLESVYSSKIPSLAASNSKLGWYSKNIILYLRDQHLVGAVLTTNR